VITLSLAALFQDSRHVLKLPGRATCARRFSVAAIPRRVCPLRRRSPAHPDIIKQSQSSTLLGNSLYQRNFRAT
jgi:hypothetical protein